LLDKTCPHADVVGGSCDKIRLLKRMAHQVHPPWMLHAESLAILNHAFDTTVFVPAMPCKSCKSNMTASSPRVPLNLHDHTELLRAVRKSISYDCFRNDLKITGLSMYPPEGRRRRFRGKPVLPTLVLQTDSSRCLNLRWAVLDHPQSNTTYFTVTAENIYQKCWDRAIATCGRRVCMNCKDMHLRIGRPNERLLELMQHLLLTYKRGAAAQSRSARCRKRPPQTA
jgi:hypothetical protein